MAFRTSEGQKEFCVVVISSKRCVEQMVSTTSSSKVTCCDACRNIIVDVKRKCQMVKCWHFHHVDGIALVDNIDISSSHGIVMQTSVAHRKAVLRRCLFSSANAAQQRHNFAFVPVDGLSEGRPVATAGCRVSGKHEKNVTQNQ
jgi:hypothetical protein